jgi:hypothetical protein
MIPYVKGNSSFPYLLIDNWFTGEELGQIWKEIDFLTLKNKLIKSATTADVAKSEDDQPLSNNFRVYPGKHYSATGFKTSPILNSVKKVQDSEFHKLVEQTFLKTDTALAKVFSGTNGSTTVIGYYEDSNRYEEHFDQYQFSLITWLYREPKNFTGGNFSITKNKTEIECVSNRTILFPGFYFHAVSPVNIINKNLPQSGRYSISTFFYTYPGEVDE